MKSRIIVTDVTRFSSREAVCTAGVAPDGRTLRPIPYFSFGECERLHLCPGTILDGEFRHAGNAAPHIEDAFCESVKSVGACSPQEFRSVLEMTSFQDISTGFGVGLVDEQKCIPVATTPFRSLFTVRIKPSDLTVNISSHRDRKITVRLQDSSGLRLSYLSITDLNLFRYIQQGRSAISFATRLRSHMTEQEVVFVRIGLSHLWKSRPEEKEGYWVQVNGIYTFPQPIPLE